MALIYRSLCQKHVALLLRRWKDQHCASSACFSSAALSCHQTSLCGIQLPLVPSLITRGRCGRQSTFFQRHYSLENGSDLTLENANLQNYLDHLIANYRRSLVDLSSPGERREVETQRLNKILMSLEPIVSRMEEFRRKTCEVQEIHSMMSGKLRSNWAVAMIMIVCLHALQVKIRCWSYVISYVNGQCTFSLAIEPLFTKQRICLLTEKPCLKKIILYLQNI